MISSSIFFFFFLFFEELYMLKLITELKCLRFLLLREWNLLPLRIKVVSHMYFHFLPLISMEDWIKEKEKSLCKGNHNIFGCKKVELFSDKTSFTSFMAALAMIWPGHCIIMKSMAAIQNWCSIGSFQQR